MANRRDLGQSAAAQTRIAEWLARSHTGVVICDRETQNAGDWHWLAWVERDGVAQIGTFAFGPTREAARAKVRARAVVTERVATAMRLDHKEMTR